MTRRLLSVLVIAAVLACAGAGAGAVALEFDGEVVQLTGAQTGDILWNKFNFGGFCYNLSDDICVGTETLTIAAYTLEGPDIDRTIDEDCLIYTTSPTWREYELYRNLGLTVDGDTGCWIEFWMGEGYVAINHKADKLTKPLVEWGGTDIKTLATGEPWNLSRGFALEAKMIDLEGEKVWFCLYKNGKEIDSEVIGTGYSDIQRRVYTYTEDVAGEDDIPIFSCYVPAVFRGTRSNMVQVKYVFLIDDNVTKIHAGDGYGTMEVKTSSSSGVTLKNNVPIDLTSNTTTPIMGNLSFKTTDSTSAIEFYPHLIREEPSIYPGGGGFVLDDCWIDSPWNLSEDYSIAAKDVSIDGDKARIVILKSGTVVGEALLTEKSKAPVDSDCYYSYVKNGTEIINTTLKDAFRGCASNVVGLTEVYQRSEVDGSILINNESYVFKSADPTGIPWDLADGYVLTMKDIGIFNGDEVWLELLKDDITLKDDILESGHLFEYINGLGSVDCIVEAVFKGCLADVVKLKNVNQYSSTGVELIENESKTYMSADPTGDEWELYEGYSFVPKDIDFNGNKAWLSLLKDGVIMKDVIVDSSKCDADRWFEYHNATGALLFSAYLNAVFRGTEHNIIQLKYVSQYSEIDGSVLIMFGEDDKKTLSTPYRLHKTWTVDDSGGADFTSIQAAIDAATSGDMVYVYAGTYAENVVVNKQLTLEGEGADVVTVQAKSPSDHVFNITVDWVNITGFATTGAVGSGMAGIYLTHVNHCNISSNNALNNRNGIYLYLSNNNSITGNTANNIWCGIYLCNSSNDNTLTDNTANNNSYGINLFSSSNNTLTRNLMSDNRCNFDLGGNSDSHFDNNIDTTNLVDGKPVYYVRGVSGVTFDSTTNAGTIYCIQCDAVTIKDLTLTNNGEGVLFWKTNNSKIENVNASSNGVGICLLSSSNNNSIIDNTANNNDGVGIFILLSSNNNEIAGNNANLNDWCGIFLGSSSNNSIIGNTANNNEYDGIGLDSSSNNNEITGNTANNNWYGIDLSSSNNNVTGNTANNNKYHGIDLSSSSNNNEIAGNTATNNKCGIHLYASSNNSITDNTVNDNSYGIGLDLSSNNNLIFHNNLVDNTNNAYDTNPASNDWHHPVLLEGNYWSDYTGVDDGSGTEKHTIAGDGIGDTDIPHPAANFDFYLFMNESGWLIQRDHDIAVTSINAPNYAEPDSTISINSTISNLGLNNESNITVDFIMGGVNQSKATIPFLESGSSENVSFQWTAPNVTGIYNLAIYAEPVVNETIVWNNQLSKNISVITIPDIWIDPEAINVTLPYGDITNRTLTIGNNGAGVLEFDISIPYGKEIFNDTFPSTTINTSNWISTSGSPVINTLGINEPSLPYSLELDGSGDMITSKVIDLSRFSNVTLSFDYELGGGGESPDSGDWLRLYYYSSNGSWTNIWSHDGDGTNHNTFDCVNVSLPSDALHANFQFRFGSSGSGATYDDFYVDDVKMVSMGTGGDWFDVTPSNGAVSPNNCTKVTVTINATDLDVGKYNATIVIANNDPDENPVNVLVNLTVTLPDHDIAVTNISTEVNSLILVNSTISNLGSSNESNITVDFLVDGANQSNTTIPFLASGSSENVSFRWTPTTAGMHNLSIFAEPVYGEQIIRNNHKEVRIWVNPNVLTIGTGILGMAGMWMNMSAGGGRSEVYTGIIPYQTYEFFDNVDLNGDGDTNDSIIMYYNVDDESKHVVDVGNRYFYDNYTIVYVVHETEHVYEWEIGDQNGDGDTNDDFHIVNGDLNGDGDMLDAFLKHYDVESGISEMVGDIPRYLWQQNVLLDNNIIIYTVPEIERLDEWEVGDQNGDGDRNDYYYNNLTDLNGDGDLLDVFLRYCDARTGANKTIDNVSRDTWMQNMQVDDGIIAYIVQETEGIDEWVVGDQNGDGDTNDRFWIRTDINSDGDTTDTILRYYDVNAESLHTVGEMNQCHPGYARTILGNNTIIYTISEAQKIYEWYYGDQNGDGDTHDTFHRYADSNNDGDFFDTLLMYHDIATGLNEIVAIVAHKQQSIQLSDGIIAYTVPETLRFYEGDFGIDQNGDGDTRDYFYEYADLNGNGGIFDTLLMYHDIATGLDEIVHIVAHESYQQNIQVADGIVAYTVPETLRFYEGDFGIDQNGDGDTHDYFYEYADLNNDGDTFDTLLRYHDVTSGVYEDITADLSRYPYEQNIQLLNGILTYTFPETTRLYEWDFGIDQNGDGDTYDNFWISNGDFNGDGDMFDIAIWYYTVNDSATQLVDVAASSYQSLGIWLDYGITAYSISEAQRIYENDVGVDQNGDGDMWDMFYNYADYSGDGDTKDFIVRYLPIERVSNVKIIQARTDKSIYTSNETVTISCVVQNETGCNITADRVDAKIIKPDSSIGWVTMTEGLLGHYNGTFTNTSLNGTYNVTIHANKTGYVSGTAEFWFEVSTLPVHNIDTGEDFATIQVAIDDSETLDSHTITVDAGIYYECVVVNKSLILQGEAGNATIIDGNGIETVVRITSDGTTVTGFTIQNSGRLWEDKDAGIEIDSDYNTLSENIITNSAHGILVGGNFNILSKNAIENNYAIGIYLDDSSNNTITENAVTNNSWDGINLHNSCNNIIYENIVTRNIECGVNLNPSDSNMITENTITNNGCSIGLSSSKSNLISHNNLVNNSNNAYDSNPADNDWHHPVLLEGNYWSDYAGVDDGSGTGKHAIAGDGIGDSNIPHPGTNYDNYPFTQENAWLPHVSLKDDAYHYSPDGINDHLYTEWWYFNVYNDDRQFIISYFLTDPTNLTGMGGAEVLAIVYDNMTLLGHTSTSNFSADYEKPNVTIGSSTLIALNDRTFMINGSCHDIYADTEIQWNLTYTMDVGSWFGAPAPMHVGHIPDDWMQWLCYMTGADVAGTITINKTTYNMSGSRGYHDHNWGEWLFDDPQWNWAQVSLPEENVSLIIGDVIAPPARSTMMALYYEGTTITFDDIDLTYAGYGFDPMASE